MTDRTLSRPRVLGASVVLAVLLTPALSRAHDMFLVVPDHDLPADQEVTVSLYNGTFEESLNVIDRDRMADVTVVDGTGTRTHPEPDRWREEGEMTLLDFRTGGPGTYVVGVSTKPNVIELTAEEFNEYLRHDGVLDVLEEREASGSLDQPARERYAKHVKTILTVGGESSDTWATRLGYPVEIVPTANPAELALGDTLELLVLDEGEPAADQLVYASHEGYHAHGDDGAHREAATLRTDAEGKAEVTLDRPGRWYVRLIRMLPTEDQETDYESNWATLTFEIGG